MAWGRIDDGSWRHRKFAALGDDLRKPCIALYWMAVSWANDHGTDGLVTTVGIRQLDGTIGEAEELVRVGLWEPGYRIHDFLQFNKSVDQLATEKAQRSVAGAAGASARYGTSPSKSPSNSLDEVPNEMDAPYPVSRTPVTPEPASITREWPHVDDEVVAVVQELTGRPITVAGLKQLQELDRQIEDHTKAKVLTTYRKAAKAYPVKPTARQLVWSARNVLEPFASPQDIKRLDVEERADEEDRAHRARLEATKRRIRELSGDVA